MVAWADENGGNADVHPWYVVGEEKYVVGEDAELDAELEAAGSSKNPMSPTFQRVNMQRKRTLMTDSDFKKIEEELMRDGVPGYLLDSGVDLQSGQEGSVSLSPIALQR